MQKKKKRIYLTLGRRFVILASVTFLLPLAIFACFSSRNYSDGINLKLQQMTDSTLALVDKNIDYIIYDIESTSTLITTNASVQSLLLDNGPQYSSDYRRKERSVWNTVINVTNNEHTAITKYRSSLAGEPIESYATLMASDWYKDLLSLRGKGAWYPGTEIPGFSSNLLVYAKAVLNMNNPETIGILLAGIGDSPFSRIFENLQVDFNAQILISQNGHTIYEYTPATEEFQASLSPMEKQTLLHTDGIVELTKKYYVRHVDNHSSGWRITCIVPYTPFLLERQNSSRTIFTIAAICFLIGVLLMCIFSNGMTRTLRKLKKYVEALRDGRSTDFISFSSNDEIGLVGNELVRVVAENQQLIQNLYQSLYKEKEAEAVPVVLLMDRFGYVKTVDNSVYERNKEAADSENKQIVPCMSDGKICLFTDNGQMHLVKVADIPYGKFRDKGIPVDNISNYDSSTENIVYITALESIMDEKLLFVTEQSMCKLVAGSEFDVSKRTTAATKLQEGDKILYLAVAEPETTLVLQSQKNYFLRFATEDIPEKKKGAVGVRGMRLGAGELLTDVWQLNNEKEEIIMIKEKAVHLNRLRIANRDTRGVKK